MRIVLKTFIFILTVNFASFSLAASVFTISTNDRANYGFNDPQSFRVEGFNNAATLGQARINAIQYAANLLSQKINSNIKIDITVKFSALGGSSRGAVLAGTSVGTFHRNFNSAPLRNTYYHAALANKLAGMDINVQTYDLGITINSDIDGNVVLGSSSWYYGFDGKTPRGDIDFVTVLMHEILHGIGFSTPANPSSGAKRNNTNDVFMLNLEQHGAAQSNYSLMTNSQRATANVSGLLHWVGGAITAVANNSAGFQNGHATMYSPSTLQPGSSVSHFSTLFSPNNSLGEMMEPGYTGPDHDIGLAAQVLEDIGWGRLNSSTNRTDLSIKITHPNQNLVVNSNEPYSITVTNNSAVQADGIIVTNFLPKNSSLVSVTPANGATCDSTYVRQNRIVSCSLSSLPPSGAATFNIVVKINSAGANLFSANTEALNPELVTLNNNAIGELAAVIESPPVLSALMNQSLEEGQVVTINLIASDADGISPTLSYSSNKQLANVIFTDNKNGTATFKWTTATSDIGDTIINFKATDGNLAYPNFTDTQSVTITVTKKPAVIIESPPVLSALMNQSLEEGQVVMINLTASDADGVNPTLGYSSNKQLSNVIFTDNKNGTATFNWTTSSADIGDTVITFKATDGNLAYPNFTDTQAVTITVTKKPVAPIDPPNPGTGTPPATGNDDVPVGGCTLNQKAKFDPLFPVLLLMLSIFYFVKKIKTKVK